MECRKIDYLKRNELESYRFSLFGKVENLQTLTAEREKISNDLDYHIKEINDDNKDDGLFSGCVIAMFDDQNEKEYYKNRFPRTFVMKCLTFVNYLWKQVSCCFSGENIDLVKKLNSLGVSEAPEPDDIIWKNLQYTTLQKLYYAAIIYLISILLIAVSFGASFGLTFIQKSYDHSDERISYALSVSNSIINTTINGLLSYTLNYLSE
jgi:hypothetical protein